MVAPYRCTSPHVLDRPPAASLVRQPPTTSLIMAAPDRHQKSPPASMSRTCAFRCTEDRLYRAELRTSELAGCRLASVVCNTGCYSLSWFRVGFCGDVVLLRLAWRAAPFKFGSHWPAPARSQSSHLHPVRTHTEHVLVRHAGDSWVDYSSFRCSLHVLQFP